MTIFYYHNEVNWLGRWDDASKRLNLVSPDGDMYKINCQDLTGHGCQFRIGAYSDPIWVQHAFDIAMITPMEIMLNFPSGIQPIKLHRLECTGCQTGQAAP